MVKDFYPNLGFKAIDGEGSSRWELYVNNYDIKECFINVK